MDAARSEDEMSGSTQGLAITTKAVGTGASPGTSTEPKSQSSTRQCPTRAEGEQPLFQHRVTVSQCQSKQRGLYHKCFTCMHANDRRG